MNLSPTELLCIQWLMVLGLFSLTVSISFIFYLIDDRKKPKNDWQDDYNDCSY